jgi:hypothetical protein
MCKVLILSMKIKSIASDTEMIAIWHERVGKTKQQ